MEAVVGPGPSWIAIAGPGPRIAAENGPGPTKAAEIIMSGGDGGITVAASANSDLRCRVNRSNRSIIIYATLTPGILAIFSATYRCSRTNIIL